MPSGHSSSGGHFGGGSFSHSGGHFGGGHSSSSHSGGHFAGSYSSSFNFHPRPHRPWYGPRVVVFGGRQVYLGSGRASASSILGVFIVISLIILAFFGFGWLDCNDKINTIETDYNYYHAMAESAAEDAAYQVEAEVLKMEQYGFNGKYCIFYRFKAADGERNEGYSFYVYSHEDAFDLWSHGEVTLALPVKKTETTWETDSVPLDYRRTKLEDDSEYRNYLASRKIKTTGTCVTGAITALLILAAVMVPMTASKATEEQIAADNQNKSNTSSAPEGTWRCSYCGTLSDNSKERCDGCGAKRQN